MRHRLREQPGRDVEFGYPVMRPENAAVSRFLFDYRPLALHPSLHGMAFSEGALLLVERHWADANAEPLASLQAGFREAARAAGLRLHDHDRRGDKGFRYYGAGFQSTPEGAAMRAHFEAQGDEETAAKFFLSSMEMARITGYDRQTGAVPLSLVTELPLFLLDAPHENVPGVPATYDRLRAALPDLLAAAQAGEDLAPLAAPFQLRRPGLREAIRLQLRVIELGLEAVAERGRAVGQRGAACSILRRPSRLSLLVVLNYIWAGLIVFSLLFAVGYDVRDLSQDTYRNGQDLPARLAFPDGYNPDARRQAVQLQLDAAAYGQFYGTDPAVDGAPRGELRGAAHPDQGRPPAPAPRGRPVARAARDGTRLHQPARPAAPGPRRRAGAGRRHVGRRRGRDRVCVRDGPLRQDDRYLAAAIDFAEPPPSIALGLIGTFALWMGLLKIAEESGVIFGSRASCSRSCARSSPTSRKTTRPSASFAQPDGQRARPRQCRHAIRHQGDGVAADAQPREGHGDEPDGDAAGDEHGERADRAAPLLVCADGPPGEPAVLLDPHHDLDLAHRRHRAAKIDGRRSRRESDPNRRRCSRSAGCRAEGDEDVPAAA